MKRVTMQIKFICPNCRSKEIDQIKKDIIVYSTVESIATDGTIIAFADEPLRMSDARIDKYVCARCSMDICQTGEELYAWLTEHKMLRPSKGDLRVRWDVITGKSDLGPDINAFYIPVKNARKDYPSGFSVMEHIVLWDRHGYYGPTDDEADDFDKEMQTSYDYCFPNHTKKDYPLETHDLNLEVYDGEEWVLWDEGPLDLRIAKERLVVSRPFHT